MATSFHLPFLLALTAVPVLAETTFEAARPILEQNCLECHHQEEGKGGLKLHSHEDFLLGGDDALAFDEKSPLESELLRRVCLPEDDEGFMPPSSEKIPRESLTATEIKTLENWLQAGAPWPKGVTLEPKEKTAPYEDPSIPDPDLAHLAVYPSQVTLETASDYHRLVILATAKDAVTRDVSASAKLTLANPEIARLDGTTLYPLSDGQTTVRIDFRGQTIELPLTVKDSAHPRPISFQQDIVPIFSSAGCNTGSCHGSARGQDGFMLSLFGYDPAGDYDRITRQQLGRRINLAIPSESLLVTKADGTVPHTGGKLFEKDSPLRQTLITWLEDGAHYDAEDVALPVSLTVEPAETVLRGERQRVQLSVTATYADGTDRDVTSLATFTSSNDNSVRVGANDGKAVSAQQGEAFLMARYHTFTEGTQNIVIAAESNYEKPNLAAVNYIDELVHTKLHKLRVAPSEVCDDETFLRRVYLDIVGLLPSPEERTHFLADASPDKRSQLIDTLLDRKEFTEIWVMKWAELLQIRTTGNNANQVTYKAATLWYEWLRERVASGTPFDQIVRELLATKGGTLTDPQTNYFKLERDIKKMSENVAQVFLGTRIQCAQCHNHPFDRWTMDDYYGFASFFAQVKRKPAEDPLEQIIYDGAGKIQNPVTKRDAIPTFLGGEPLGETDRTRREEMADWLTSPENPWFASNVSNIVWAHFFGRGIVEPVDDARISNPPSNPALLAALGDHLISYNFDLKMLVRDICNSRTYQLSTIANETNALDETNFSKAKVRRLRAEVLLDVIAQVTHTPNKFKGLPPGARAVQIADGNTTNYFLRTFGRATRTTVCSCEVKMEPNLSQALHLLNGDSTHKRIDQGKVLATLRKKDPSQQAIIRNLYLLTLTREPTAQEFQHLLAEFESRESQEEKDDFYPDLFWALLNSKEFIFNH